jgi:hypothetical protein
LTLSLFTQSKFPKISILLHLIFLIIDHDNSFRLLLWHSFHGWLMTIVFILKVTTTRCHTIKLGNVLLYTLSEIS